ncbi:N-acetylmuramoyl-L-alanine amidase [Catelliglobosispora koreensis]|uniref:N-acetylmuramoyl-L-alanine amidase n=1 Tax=Catelliglobosispora koreensis TaxID=129052 RepID=UPI0003826943|nr:N-acetylmuramoyl-L-alanine amidase [Catelliglobosispora koreensis]
MTFIQRRTLLAAAAGVAAAPFAASPAFAAVPKVYIDPGHGGTDPGASANGLTEKHLTLAIALQTRDFLLARGNVAVRMSRTSDITRSLTWRTDDANAWGATIFVSIHINAGGGTGFESYRYPGTGATTQRLHSNVHSRVLSGMRTIAAVTDRGQKTANFHVLRETAMPAVLTENLFVDRVADANLLKRADFITATARGHANGIALFLGI